MANIVTRLQIFDSPDWLDLDLFPDFAITAGFSYYSINAIANLEMPISARISLPNTESNRLRLGVANDASLKPTDLEARVLVDGVVIYKYRLKIDSLITLGLNERIECTLIDPLKEAVEKLRDKDLSDLVGDGEYDEPFSTAGIEAINNNADDFIRIIHQDFNGFGEDDARVFAFRPDTDFDAKDGVQQIVPALQVKKIFSKAFSGVGLTYDSKFFEGTSEIENYPVDDLYLTTPTRFFLDKDKDKPTGGTWATERTSTNSFWKANNRANVFGFTELYDPSNPNQIGILSLNYLRRNNIISGNNGSQSSLYDISALNSSNGVFTTYQMVFKKPARYIISLSQTVTPRLGVYRNGGTTEWFGRTDVIDASGGVDEPTGKINIKLVVSVNGAISQVNLGTIDFADSSWDSVSKEFSWPSMPINVDSSFYVDIDAGDVVEMFVTMESAEARLKYQNQNGNSYDLNLNEFGKNPAFGSYFIAFVLGTNGVPIYQTEPWGCSVSGIAFGNSCSAGIPLSEPVYDITFSPYEEFPASTLSGSEYMDFKFNLAKSTEMSLWDVMTDIAKRFNMSIIYDFATDAVIVDNLLEEYIKPASTEAIAYLFDNASELTQDFNTSSIKSIKLLNANGNSLSDAYKASTSPFASENEVESFGSLNLLLDQEGDRDESFQSKMLLANGSIFGDRLDITDFDDFKERAKYGVPNNKPLRCSEMGLRLGFLTDSVETRIYEPIYSVSQNMVKMEYKLENSLNPSALLPTLREYSSPVLVGGDIETYNLRFDDNTDAFRAYQNFWATFVNTINDLPSIDCTLVIEAGDLNILDFRKKYDFGYGNTVLVSLSGFDFTLKGSEVKAKFLLL